MPIQGSVQSSSGFNETSLQSCVYFAGGGDGSEGTEVTGTKQDRVLHDGGGGRRETTDGPGGGFQTHVSLARAILRVCEHRTHTLVCV